MKETNSSEAINQDIILCFYINYYVLPDTYLIQSALIMR